MHEADSKSGKQAKQQTRTCIICMRKILDLFLIRLQSYALSGSTVVTCRRKMVVVTVMTMSGIFHFRLGGGLFSDTYLAEWKTRVVAVKRLTVGIHQNQLNERDVIWIVHQLGRLRFVVSKLTEYDNSATSLTSAYNRPY